MKINARNSPLFAQGQAKWDTFVQAYTGPYDLSTAVYAGMNQKVHFRCPTHGQVQMDAKNLMAGKTCMQCAFAARAGRGRFTTRKVVERFVQAHGAAYDYSGVMYRTQQTPVAIGCYRHGEFLQLPEFHWAGSGCPQCFHEDRRGAAQRDTLESFSAKLADVLPTLRILDGQEYGGTYKKLRVMCLKHNLTWGSCPNYMLNGFNPCGRCTAQQSRGEGQVFSFLSNLTPAEARNRTIIKPKELDIYLPERKLAVEYCGEYFHSHGDAAEEKAKKRNHAQKYEVCKAQGIRLITLWESEWKDHNYAVRRLLRNAVGKSKGKLMARKCELRKVTTTEARPFYERYHPQGGAGSGEHYALFWNSKMVACMRFVLGANDRGDAAANRTWTLGRYATRVTVAGAASRLFKAFLHEHNPPVVKSFSDNRFFEGGMYAQLGFVLEGDVPPDYTVWHPKLGVLPKPHYQRRQIPKRLAEVGSCEVFDPAADPRTEKEMTYLMGARRLYDCGKKRWTYSNPLCHNPPNSGTPGVSDGPGRRQAD